MNRRVLLVTLPSPDPGDPFGAMWLAQITEAGRVSTGLQRVFYPWPNQWTPNPNAASQALAAAARGHGR